MKKIINLKSALIFLLVTVVGATVISWLSSLEFLVSFAIIGGALLVNGLIIALIDD